MAFLGYYSGYVHYNAYKGYDAFFGKDNAIEVACWSRSRHKFYDALVTNPRRSHEMLAMISKLYTVEQQSKEDGLDAIVLKKTIPAA